MLEHLRNEANLTLTENGGAAFASTGSECLDLFATAGALRDASAEELIIRFTRAFAENRDLAMKLLFFARDIRGGLGERRFFRTVLRSLAFTDADSVSKNIGFIAEYGRWDDLLVLLGTPCESGVLAVLRAQFDEDMACLGDGGASISLLGKWLPSVNASNKDTVAQARRIAEAFGMNCAEYRKALTALRARIRIIENNLREKDYTFDYSAQPSRAMFKYRKAFLRNDRDRYTDFINDVTAGNKAMHADNVAPYELVQRVIDKDLHEAPVIDGGERSVLDATWKSIPDYCDGENAIAVVDGSGSMYAYGRPLPASVALSLGIYLAEHSKGAFAGHFITFSSRPQLVELKGADFVEKVRNAASYNEITNTNLEAVFDLILRAAVRNNVPQEELPSKLVIISDMEFDCGVSRADETVFRGAVRRFAQHGYKLPQVVFWNAQSRSRQQPVTLNEQGVALVSGVTPRIFEMVAGELQSPYALMEEILLSERYAKITA